MCQQVCMWREGRGDFRVWCDGSSFFVTLHLPALIPVFFSPEKGIYGIQCL
jgi:hypothetical protein